MAKRCQLKCSIAIKVLHSGPEIRCGRRIDDEHPTIVDRVAHIAQPGWKHVEVGPAGMLGLGRRGVRSRGRREVRGGLRSAGEVLDRGHDPAF